MAGTVVFFGEDGGGAIQVTGGPAGSDGGDQAGAPPEPVKITNPAALAPPGGVAVPPSQPGATMEWRTDQDWATVLSGYYDAFPIDGMALDPKPNGETTNDGDPIGESHPIIASDATSTPGLSPYLLIRRDPNNPTGSTVSLFIYD